MHGCSRELSLQRILERLRQALPDLNNRFGAVSLSVFGSRVRESSGAFSDVDVLLEFTRPPGFFRFVELEDELSLLLGIKVDLVSFGVCFVPGSDAEFSMRLCGYEGGS